MARDILRRRPNVCVRAGYVSFDSTLLSVTPTDENFILCFGRIDVHMKGIDILLPAFEKIASRFPNHALIIAGRGKESDIAWVKTRIAASPFRERIRCETNTSDEEKKRLFRTATFVCMPSRFEGWNIAAIEAAASSKATLGTKIHGLSDAIKENETGILVPAQDADALSEQMAVLLADSDLRRKLGTAGHAWAANFTLERVTKIQEEFYQQILEM
jgi:glycosyltransferase involved in cell wall biosynthesis